MLSVQGVAKRFGATHALRGVQLDVADGEVHALVGGNGCGKSTLIKCLAGVYQADRGVATVGDHKIDLTRQTPDAAVDAGLRFVHQDLGIFPSLSVAENLVIRTPGLRSWGGRLDRKRAKSLTESALGRFGVKIDPTELAGALSPPEKAMVAIGRALLGRPPGGSLTLVLDEPTASLSRREAEALLTVMRELAAGGDAVLFVTHRLDEVRRVADRVTAFRDGRYVGTRSAGGLTNADLAELILGESVPPEDTSAAVTTAENGRGREVVLDVRHLRGAPLEDVTFEVREGEIVGVAGLVGSGRSELLRMVYGLLAPSGGSIAFRGEELHGHTATACRRKGMAFVSEDRLGEGVFTDRTVADNLVAGDEAGYFRFGLMQTGVIRSEVKDDLREYGIRAASGDALIESLSGGNQQKVVLARWLRRDPKLLLLDEPTQGVDVGARQEIYGLIRRSAEAGSAVVVVSSEFEELVLLCDRVIVLAGGRVVRSLCRPLREADLIAASIGHDHSDGAEAPERDR